MNSVVFRKLYGKFLPSDRSAMVIDVGCGQGSLVHWLHSAGYHQAEGIDINRDRVDFGIQAGVKNLHHGDAMSFLRDKRERYDVVFLVDILSYLSKEEIRDLLDTVSGVLKPGGTLIVKNANAESPMAGRLQHADFKREVNFTESSLKNVLRNVGFKKVGAYPLRPVVHGVKSFVRYCLWRFVEGILKFYRLIETGSPHGVFTQSIIVVANK